MAAAAKLLLVLGAACAAGCVAKQDALVLPPLPAAGSVGAEMVEAPVEARYETFEGVDYLAPRPSMRNAMPVYPEHLLDRRLPPTQLTARLVVEKEGLVALATILDDDVPEPAFSEAVLAAVRDWTFSPLTRVEGMAVEPLPFTQDYRFTFRQADGRGAVEAGADEQDLHP